MENEEKLNQMVVAFLFGSACLGVAAFLLGGIELLRWYGIVWFAFVGGVFIFTVVVSE